MRPESTAPPSHTELSAAQRALWAGYQSNPRQAALNVGIAVWAGAPVEVAELRRAIAAVARRHAALRTCLADRAGGPYRVISADAAPELVVEDVAGRDEDEIRARAERWRLTPFDLTAAPAFRVVLLRGAKYGDVLLVAGHPILTDFRSQGIVLTELLQLYVDPDALAGSVAAKSPASSLSTERLRDYWLAACAGAENVFQLPRDRARPARQSGHGRSHAVELPADLLRRAKELGQASRTSAFAVLLAAFQVVLRNHGGQSDFLVGCPVDLRRESRVGPFGNVLALRASVAGERSFLDQLAETQGRIAGGLRHAAYPFASLVEDLGVRPDPSMNPLCQVAFCYQATSAADPLLDLVAAGEGVAGPVTVGGPRVRPLDLPRQEGRFDLAVEVLESSHGARIVLRYDDALFDHATIARLAGHYLVLLADAVSRPEAEVADLSMIDAGELALLERHGRGTRVPLAVRSVVELIARNDPGAPAIETAERTITYAGLDTAAGRLATLIGAAEAPGRVAVLLPDRADTITAALAAWRAGRAFVPLDPAHPGERLAYLLRDCRPAVLVTTRQHERTAAAARLPAVFLEDLHESVRPAPPSPPAQDDVACVTYTSGSGGPPTGVEITHGGLANLARWQRRFFGVSAGDRIMQFASPSFDAFVWETALALCNGAVLCCPPPGAVLTGPDLAGALAAANPTVITLPPSALATITPDACPAGLHTVVVAGEACPSALAAAWAARVRLVNAYGPAESTLCASAYVFGGPSGAVRIGTPVDNVDLLVVDERGRPAPIGVPGHLLIGGHGLAKGYLGRSGLTGERFPTRDGRRVYRTGDIVRWDESGNLRFERRDDRQAKRHGHRVEPGEVEHALATHPAVRQAAVTGALVAYAVTDGTATAADLRAHLRSRLPRYLEPRHVVVLGSLPLTANGKLDWAALPEPGSPAAEEHAVSATERAVSRVWAELLDGQDAGRDSDFFTLGGHSLIAARVAALLRRRLRRHVTAAGVMAHPCLADLARHIDEQPSAAADPYRWQDPRRPFPLTETQVAYWLGRGGAAELVPLGYVEFAVAHLDLFRLQTAWDAVLARHDMLRAVVTEDGRQRVLAQTPPFSIRCHDLAAADPQTVHAHLAELRERMKNSAFDPGAWPAFDLRATLGPGGADHLHLAVDAVFVDGGSLQIILRDLATAYHSGHLPPPPKTSFAAVAGHAPSAQDRRTARRHWTARLATLPPAPGLPARDHPRTAGFGTLTGRLRPETWRAIRRKARQESLTPTSVLLTAYAEVLAAWSRDRAFTVNVTRSDRPAHLPGIDEVVGDFTALLLTEIDLTARAPFRDAARRVQRQLIDDLRHASFSGIRVLRERARLRDGGVTPVAFTSLLGSVPSSGTLGRLTELATRTPQVRLDHVVLEDDGELVLSWNHREGAFPAGVVEDMFDRYLQLLHDLADPETWTRRVRLGLTRAQAATRRKANATGTPRPRGRLHDPFFAMAAISPEQTAVIDSAGSVTYGELAERANAVRRHLEDRGVRPEEPIAVAARRGRHQIAGVLGVLAAGAAYLPINRDLPPLRRRELLERSGARLLLDAGPAADADADIETITVDTLPPAPDDPGQGGQDGSQLAYIVHTSGAKGVLIEHRAARNTVDDINRRFAVQPGDRLLALTDLSFDLSVYDIFCPLSAGAALVVPDPDRAADPDHWLDLMAGHGVTLWNSVPVLARLLADRLDQTGGTAALDRLRLVLLSGDRIPSDLPARLRRWTSADLIGLGGATETSTWSAVHDIGTQSPGPPGIPYGKPLANQTLHVLDDLLDERPAWVPGQLYIGGAGLARGYLDDPGDAFIVHPRTGKRLYRTGDLARYRDDGVVELLGREDDQVTINGHRLELGELESVLRRCEGIDEAVVVAPAGTQGNRTLHAYVRLDQETARKAAEASTGAVTTVVSPGVTDAMSTGVVTFAEPAAISDDRWREIPAAAASIVADADRQDDLRQLAVFERRAERLAGAVICQVLRAHGLFAAGGERHTAEEVRQRLGAAPDHHELIIRWLDTLVEDHYLTGAGSHYISEAPLPCHDLDGLWERCAAAATWGEPATRLLGYLRACAARLPQLLAGETDPAGLLPPCGSPDATDALHSANPLLELCNQLTALAVATIARPGVEEGEGEHTGQGRGEHVGQGREERVGQGRREPAGHGMGERNRQRDVARPLRILELGAGTGGTASAVLPLLPPTGCEYYVTDPSESLLTQSRRRLGGYPQARFRRVDIDRLPYEPGIQTAHFDLVIVANALRHTRNPDRTLDRIRGILAPGGGLILIEGTGTNRMDLISLAFLERLHTGTKGERCDDERRGTRPGELGGRHGSELRPRDYGDVGEGCCGEAGGWGGGDIRVEGYRDTDGRGIGEVVGRSGGGGREAGEPPGGERSGEPPGGERGGEPSGGEWGGEVRRWGGREGSVRGWLERLRRTGFQDAAVLLGPADQPLAALAQAVIIARADTERPALDTRRLRDHLAERLPAYAVPAHVRELTDLPVTANGEIDRAALARAAEIAPARRGARATTPARQTLTTSAVLAVWREVLNDAAVQAEDTLFECGGDSVTAIRLAAALKDRLQVEVRAKELLTAATPSAIAALFDSRGLPIMPSRDDRGAPMTPSRDGGGLPIAPSHEDRSAPITPSRDDRGVPPSHDGRDSPIGYTVDIRTIPTAYTPAAEPPPASA